MTHLAENKVEPNSRANKPANFGQLQERLKQPRAELELSNFSEQQFEFFLDALENAADENMVMSDVFTKIRGDHIYPSTQNRPCGNWKPLIDADLVIPKPDFFDGVRKGSKYREIRKALDTIIVPSTMHDCPFLPNLFGEAKAPKGSGDIAERQACYDGAMGARAMHHLQSYATAEIYDHNAYTFTFTYSRGFLEIYAHHMSQPDGPCTQPHYHMTSLASYALRHSRQTFIEGATALRNLRDIAHELRESFLADADQRMRDLPQEVRERLIGEAMKRVQESLPEMSSLEDAVRNSQNQASNGGGSQTSASEANADDSDITITPKRQATKRRRDHKTVYAAKPKQTPNPKTGSKSKPTRKVKMKLRSRTNTKAKAH